MEKEWDERTGQEMASKNDSIIKVCLVYMCILA